MPDIAMCYGESTDKSIVCLKRETCFRFKATPSEFRQTYFMGLPYDPTADECKHFLPMIMKETIERELP